MSRDGSEGEEIRPDPAAAGTRRRTFGFAGKLLFIVFGLVLLLWLGRMAGGRLPDFVEWVNSRGIWAPLIFIAGYAVATVAFVPGSLLTLTAGAVFGIGRGTAFVLIGAVIGSSLAFLVSRHLARPYIEKRVVGDPRFDRIDRAIGREGFRIVLLLRLSPVLPYNLLNYALGLTRVSFRDYVLAAVGMVPGTLLWVYSGKVAGEVAALAGGAGVARGPGYYAVLALGLLATVSVTVWLTRIARRAMQDESIPATRDDDPTPMSSQ